MITDDDRHFSMGVGGTVHLNTFYDFGGSMDGYSFSPGTIAIPVDNTGNFGYTATGSNIFVKARATKGKHKLTAYLQLAGAEINGTDYVLLSKAYVSVDGLTASEVLPFMESADLMMEVCMLPIRLNAPTIWLQIFSIIFQRIVFLAWNISMDASLSMPVKVKIEV